ncbi:hypothetical protein JKF63_05496 [Porcisia hertigi]|uniref:Uncharacterized protein n=1 Tax=Porcisia hertigi TaxID=2761500 RepID=A0A836IXZ9_9TRYP|nr:hypothetical protein JKF63_05496 [Porcisia hertigi]
MPSTRGRWSPSVALPVSIGAALTRSSPLASSITVPTPSALELSPASNMLAVSTASGVSSDWDSVTYDSDEGSEVHDLLELQGRRWSVGDSVCNTHNIHRCVSPSHRGPRAISADKTPPRGSHSPTAVGRRLPGPAGSTVIATFKARPGTAVYTSNRSAGPPMIPSESTTLTNLPTAPTSVVAASSLFSALYTPNASATRVILSSDTLARRDSHEQFTSLTVSSVEFPKPPQAPRYDRGQQRQYSRSILTQRMAQEEDVEAEAVPAMPTQLTLSRSLSLLRSPHQGQSTGGSPTESPRADPAVAATTDSILIGDVGGSHLRFPSRRGTESSTPPAVSGSDVYHRTGASVDTPHQTGGRSAISVEEIAWRGVADLASFSSGVPSTGDTVSTRPTFLLPAHTATTEERRVRLLFHGRPRVLLTERPRVVTNPVLDRPGWTRPLCDPLLFIPCMRNKVYSLPPRMVTPTSWEPELFGHLLPSLASTSDAPARSRDPQPRHFSSSVHRGSHVSSAPIRTPPSTTPLIYDVPVTAQQLGPRSAGDLRPHNASLHHTPAAWWPNPLDRTPARLGEDSHRAVFIPDVGIIDSLGYISHNCRHLLYRCFCVRCAIASQAQALQADANMRSAKTSPFPSCSCLGVESASYANILCFLSLLDFVTLGMPFGCCCYHGLGTTLYGWHLRYMLRARYHIFSWTSIDLLIMCCIPGLAVEQQGAELLLNGTPEATVGLHFMS